MLCKHTWAFLVKWISSRMCKGFVSLLWWTKFEKGRLILLFERTFQQLSYPQSSNRNAAKRFREIIKFPHLHVSISYFSLFSIGWFHLLHSQFPRLEEKNPSKGKQTEKIKLIVGTKVHVINLKNTLRSRRNRTKRGNSPIYHPARADIVFGCEFWLRDSILDIHDYFLIDRLRRPTSKMSEAGLSHAKSTLQWEMVFQRQFSSSYTQLNISTEEK